ncbi:hypothetical protein D9758_015796 [Tetrapyrgos nigripes]|uniref:F-box domain-containing protein n=1 Tax=Tetrapyrgos nigripes TaxID=182062 RepID=A0A8H5FCA0_9AGAR|nr:hypothetical protein D9758_015796 [Tetrapyrgos nigripes]
MTDIAVAMPSSQEGPVGLPSCPNETIGHIIDHLGPHDKRSLVACSTVCRRFTYFAQKILFSKVTLIPFSIHPSSKSKAWRKFGTDCEMFLECIRPTRSHRQGGAGQEDGDHLRDFVKELWISGFPPGLGNPRVLKASQVIECFRELPQVLELLDNVESIRFPPIFLNVMINPMHFGADSDPFVSSFISFLERPILTSITFFLDLDYDPEEQLLRREMFLILFGCTSCFSNIQKLVMPGVSFVFRNNVGGSPVLNPVEIKISKNERGLLDGMTDCVLKSPALLSDWVQFGAIAMELWHLNSLVLNCETDRDVTAYGDFLRMRSRQLWSLEVLELKFSSECISEPGTELFDLSRCHSLKTLRIILDAPYFPFSINPGDNIWEEQDTFRADLVRCLKTIPFSCPLEMVTLVFNEPVLEWVRGEAGITAVYHDLDKCFVREDLSRLQMVKIIARGLKLGREDIEHTLTQTVLRGILDVEIRI